MEFVDDTSPSAPSVPSVPSVSKLKPLAPLAQIQKSVQVQKDVMLSKLGKYALENFGKSKYARKSLNTVPTSIMAGIFKAVVNFLIVYRLTTENFWVNLIISLVVTVVTALISPVFYVIVQEREQDLMRFSNHFADHLMVHGFDYLRMWQGRTIFALGVMAIIFLFLVEVNSSYLIQWIMETLLALWVVDRVNQWRDSIFLPVPVEIKKEFIPTAHPLQLTKYDYVKIPLSRARQAETPSEKIIQGYKKPLRARRITISAKTLAQEQQEQKQQEQKQQEKQPQSVAVLLGGTMRNIMEDWVRLDGNEPNQQKRKDPM